LVPPEVVGAAVLVAGVVAAGALVVDFELDPQALAMTATRATAASRKNLFTTRAPFSIDRKNNTTPTEGRVAGSASSLAGDR
jgi:hypothetical protein